MRCRNAKKYYVKKQVTTEPAKAAQGAEQKVDEAKPKVPAKKAKAKAKAAAAS